MPESLLWAAHANTRNTVARPGLFLSEKGNCLIIMAGHPIKLTPGTYWFVFYPEMSFTTCVAQYGRHVSDTTNGYVAQVINPGGGFGFPDVWTSVQSVSTWGLTQQDFAFRLEGNVAGANMGAIYLLLLGD